jgi:hypothetical protein
MNTTILQAVTEHLNAGANRRIVVGSPHCRKPLVFSPTDLPNIKAEGSGLRIGKTFVFACQVHFARTAA